MAETPESTLYYGDNLDVLREHNDGSVDLVYLDPPFNSNRSYNVIFAHRNVHHSDDAGRGAISVAQMAELNGRPRM